MRRDHLPILILIAGTALGVTLLAPFTWAVLLAEGMLTLTVVAAAAGWGAWPTAWLGFGRRSAAQQVCIATALGLGLLSLLTLVLGVVGVLNRPAAWTLLAIGGVAGLARLYLTQAERTARRDRTAAGKQPGAIGAGAPPFAPQGAGQLAVRVLLLLLLTVPLVVALFGASLPPGVLWPEEANGYDVLEYHLQGPREYYDAGRITFLSHNVYTSFPQQMEMLYLLLMHLAGNAYAAAIPAQLLHAACGILMVVALASWTKPGWPRHLVILLAGSTPWLAYLGCLAYVENGMLFFAAVAAGLLINLCREQQEADWRAILTAGLCAGLAGGCKYTALVFIALGLALAWFIAMRASLSLRARRIGVFGVGVLVAFSPWLVRNLAFTGNPVYPLAYEWFDGKSWSTAQAQQWSAGHRVQPPQDTAAGRLTIAARELFGRVKSEPDVSQFTGPLTRGRFRPSLFGQALFLLALAGIVLGRSRHAIMLTIWAVLIALGWICLTSIPGRFAVPLIAPLALLGGECVADDRSRLRWPILLVALAGALINDISLGRRLREHNEYWKTSAGVCIPALVAQTSVFVDANLLTEELPADAYAWLVGEAAVFYVDRKIHYTVPFSRDPWLEFASGAEPHECLDWLRERSVSHVVFSWSEIVRLRQTYGFSDVVTPQWVARLEQAGLQHVKTEQSPFGGAPVEIYEVPATRAD